VFVLLLSVTPLGLGIVTSLPQTRFADSVQVLSDGVTRLLASAPWHAGARQLGNSPATEVQTVRPSWTLFPPFKAGDGSVITYGDQLKVTFFESLGVNLGDNGGGAEHDVAAVFPRMDLSGDYALDEGGSVNIPKLGQFAASGKTITALQSELASAFVHAIGRVSDVHIAITERQPIYVLGTVRNAGTFKYTPGMIALQAIANAGGIDLGVVDTSRVIENIRETERLRQQEDKLDHLLIQQAKLIAERDNTSTIAVPASIRARLPQVMQQDGLNALIAEAATSLGVEHAAQQQQSSLADRQVGIAKIEVEAQNLRAEQLKVLVGQKTEKLHELEQIAARGSVSQLKLMDANVEISALVAQQQDLRAALAQAQRRLVEAEIAQSTIKIAQSVDLEKKLTETQQDIDDCNHAIASMKAVTQVLRDSIPESVGGSARHPELKITRRVAEGFSVMPATEMTVLVPGDVINVNSANRTDASTPEVAQHLQN
jgi:protein involved in polysaccharide export with SLBB domain